MATVNDVWDERTVDYSSVAALAFLVWDVLITFADEVKYIWSKPNGYWAKWLFLWVRYFAIAIQIALLFVGTEIASSLHYSPHACVSWYIFQEVASQLLIASVEIILMVRVHALYDRNRTVTATLLLLFLIENVAMTGTLAAAVSRVELDSSCIVIHSPHMLIYFAVAFVLFETVLFLLTMFKFVVAVRSGWGHAPVLTLLVRDGTWAFTLIFVTLCVNAGFYLGTDTPLTSVAYPWLLSIEAFAGTRLILNMLQTLDNTSLSTDTALSSRIVFTANFAEDVRTRERPRRSMWDGMMGLGPPGTGVDWTQHAEYEMTLTTSDGTSRSGGAAAHTAAGGSEV